MVKYASEESTASLFKFQEQWKQSTGPGVGLGAVLSKVDFPFVQSRTGTMYRLIYDYSIKNEQTELPRKEAHTHWRAWLIDYATSRKVAGSVPDEKIPVFD